MLGAQSVPHSTNTRADNDGDTGRDSSIHDRLVKASPLVAHTHFKFVDVHSFIHYGDLYSAPSRLLLRSAPDPCTAKKKSFETRVECVRKSHGKQSLRQRKPIPHRGTNHRECTGLGCGCTSKRNKE